MSKSKKSSLEGFDTVGQRIYLHRASDPAPTSSTAPDLIVLCTWMDAAAKHISIYAQQYIDDFPNSTILLIRSSAGDVFSSAATHAKRLIPALEFLESFSASSSSNTKKKPRVLLHAFSNGGSIVALYLALNLRARKKATQPFFVKLILDCTPSAPKMDESVRAMTIAFHNSFFLVRLLAEMIMRVAFVCLRLYQTVFRVENSLHMLRRRLNEPGLFPGPRMYLYSEKDKMVGADSVKEHIVDAREKGFEVEEVKFRTAAHCALAVEDFDKYWGAVRRFFGSEAK